MKKILLGLLVASAVSAMAADNGVNVYGRFGLDIVSRYNEIKDDNTGKSVVDKKGKVAPSITLELTKNLNKNFELGLGLGYIWHGDRDFEHKEGSEKYRAEVPAINSIPLYATGKVNFDTNSNFKPYIKTDLGYSFNTMKKSTTLYVTDATGYTETRKLEGLKAKNGIYFAIGVGMEYMNFTTDLSYVFTGSKIKSDDGSDKANNNALRLTVGYKFNF